MAITSPIKSPSTTVDTPTPYRVPTSAVRIWNPPQPTTAEYKAIRAQITPNRNWWQFPLPPMPWEAVLAFKVWALTVGIGALTILVHSFLASIR